MAADWLLLILAGGQSAPGADNFQGIIAGGWGLHRSAAGGGEGAGALMLLHPPVVSLTSERGGAREAGATSTTFPTVAVVVGVVEVAKASLLLVYEVIVVGEGRGRSLEEIRLKENFLLMLAVRGAATEATELVIAVVDTLPIPPPWG